MGFLWVHKGSITIELKKEKTLKTFQLEKIEHKEFMHWL